MSLGQKNLSGGFYTFLERYQPLLSEYVNLKINFRDFFLRKVHSYDSPCIFTWVTSKNYLFDRNALHEIVGKWSLVGTF